MSLAALHEMASNFPHDWMGRDSTCGVQWALYGLVRLCRPERVVEIGSLNGHTTSFLVQAMLDNGNGTVTAFEKDPAFAKSTWETVEKFCGEIERLSVLVGDFFDYGIVGTDFAFIDLEPKTDYLRAFQQLDIPVGGVVCAHDLTYAEDPVKALFKYLLENGYEGVGFPQERGLIVARRVA